MLSILNRSLKLLFIIALTNMVQYLNYLLQLLKSAYEL